MRYKTTNELEHFNFKDSCIADVQAAGGFFHMAIDNVTILPENSCNRDIREMRTNGLLLKIENPVVLGMIQEGYKVYDANGKLMQACEDAEIASEAYAATIKTFAEGFIYSLEKKENKYVFVIDAADERSYQLIVEGSGDMEEWDRFLNI